MPSPPDPPVPDLARLNLVGGVAARLLHDMAGPLSAMASGLDLFVDTADSALKADAIDLVRSGLADLEGLLTFCRAAYASGGVVGEDALAALSQVPFNGRRARLRWSTSPPVLEGAAVQAVLLVCQIAAAGLGVGGDADIAVAPAEGRVRIVLEASARRITLEAPLVEALLGRPATSPIAGRSAPARYLHALASGGVSFSADETGFRLTVEVATPFAVG